MYKLDGATTSNQVWFNGQYVGSAPINNFWQTSSIVAGDVGSLNIYRFIRYRMAGNGTLMTSITDQGMAVIEPVTSVMPLNSPGNYKDIGFQINFTNEKAIVRFGMNGLSDFIRMSRFDIFGKARWPTRPNG